MSPNVKEPCIPCECNPFGTVGVCASIGGACTCKPGFVGRKCSECAPGYSGPNCTQCACDSRGTMPGGVCESHCQCKVIFKTRENDFKICFSAFHKIFAECFSNYSLTLKENFVINVCSAILDCPNQITKDAQNVIAQAWQPFVKVATL